MHLVILKIFQKHSQCRFLQVLSKLKIIIFYGRIILHVLTCPPCFGFCVLQRWMSHEKLSNLSLPVTQISVGGGGLLEFEIPY